MNALPCEPWQMKVSFRRRMNTDLALSEQLQWLEIRVNLQRDDGIAGVQQMKPGASERFEILLPGLLFDLTDTEASTNDLSSEAVNASVMLRGDLPSLACAAGSDVLAQANELLKVIRVIIAPILAGKNPSSVDEYGEDYGEDCARAIMRSKQPLAGLLVVDAVEVRLSKLQGRKPNSKATGAFAMTPGAYIPPSYRKYIALGSNLGDRVEAIENACQSLDRDGDIRVVETSPLYETEPMYVEDQDRFLNGVCEVCIPNLFHNRKVPR